VIIISTAFPNVALRRPLITSLWRLASSSSVASPRIFASGIKEAKFSQKVHVEPQSRLAERRPSGNAASRMLKGWYRIDFMPRAFRSQADPHGWPPLRLSEDCLLRSRFACQMM